MIKSSLFDFVGLTTTTSLSSLQLSKLTLTWRIGELEGSLQVGGIKIIFQFDALLMSSCHVPEHYKSSSVTVILLWAGWRVERERDRYSLSSRDHLMSLKWKSTIVIADLWRGIRAENVHTESTELKFHFLLWNIWIFVIISQSCDFSLASWPRHRVARCHLTPGTTRITTLGIYASQNNIHIYTAWWKYHLKNG